MENTQAELILLLTHTRQQLHQETTQRRQAQQALIEERNLLQTLIDLLPDHVYVKDCESRFLIANMAVARTLEVRSPDELVGKTDFDFSYPPGFSQQYYADEQIVMQTGQSLINRVST